MVLHLCTSAFKLYSLSTLLFTVVQKRRSVFVRLPNLLHLLRLLVKTTGQTFDLAIQYMLDG